MSAAVFKRDRVLLAEVAAFSLGRGDVALNSVAGLPAPEPVRYRLPAPGRAARHSRVRYWPASRRV